MQAAPEWALAHAATPILSGPLPWTPARPAVAPRLRFQRVTGTGSGCREPGLWGSPAGARHAPGVGVRRRAGPRRPRPGPGAGIWASAGCRAGPGRTGRGRGPGSRGLAVKHGIDPSKLGHLDWVHSTAGTAVPGSPGTGRLEPGCQVPRGGGHRAPQPGSGSAASGTQADLGWPRWGVSRHGQEHAQSEPGCGGCVCLRSMLAVLAFLHPFRAFPATS